MPVMPVIISRMLSGSTGLGFGSFDSGTMIGARISSGIRIGTASRNTEPQSKCSSRKPPTIGPSAAPAENPEAHTAIAMRRSVASTKILRIIDRVAGMSMAPKIPSRARATTSISAEGANAASAEIAAKPVEPMSSSLRRPMRSPIAPMGTSRAESTSG